MKKANAEHTYNCLHKFLKWQNFRKGKYNEEGVHCRREVDKRTYKCDKNYKELNTCINVKLGTSE